jgi:hypothetical protein
MIGVYHVPEVPNEHRAQVQSLDHPVVLRVTIAVLVRSESVCDTLQGVYDGAGKVIGRVYLPLIPKQSISILPRHENQSMNTQYGGGEAGYTYKSQDLEEPCWDCRHSSSPVYTTLRLPLNQTSSQRSALSCPRHCHRDAWTQSRRNAVDASQLVQYRRHMLCLL